MRIIVTASALCMSIVGLSMADEVHASIKQSTNIPAQPLAPALQSLAKDRGFQVIYVSEEIGDRRTGGAVGEYTPEEALQQLLSGTGLTYKYLDDQTVTILPVNAQNAPRARTESVSAAASGANNAKGVKQDTSNSFRLAQTSRAAPGNDSSVDKSKENQPVVENAPVQLEEVVVTTRVIREGYQAPTPLSVISAASIAANAPSNIANFVDELPSMQGASPRSNIASVSAGVSGLNSLNLRNLGGQRTLVLLDGQRVGAATLTDYVDINEFPEELIKRVDVVTGGASADWGSDAVAGVVNFVLDKDFTGVKGEVQGGTTTYGDDTSYKASLAAGTGFMQDRGHILFAAEDAHNDGVTGAPRPWANDANNKLIFANPAYTATNGQPQYLVANNSGFATATPGGIITSGPLKGTYFGPGGTPGQFNYGPLVSGNFMQGGQSAYANFFNSVDLDPEMARRNVFLRTSFDVTDHFQIFGQASYAAADTYSHVADNNYFGNLTINADNALIPAATAAAIATYNAAHQTTPITSFNLGTLNYDEGPSYAVTHRSNGRYIVGANGDFDAFDSRWTWDSYAQESVTNIYTGATLPVTANYKNAIDAVRNPTTGAIQCASVATNPSCVPYDVFGTGVNSAAALDYVEGTSWLRQQLRQNVEAGNLRGTPFSDWAGPVSVAAGVEHRRESTSGYSDSLDAAAFAASLVPGGVLASPYFAGNYHPSFGSYDVNEGYLETVAPVAKDVFLAKALDFNGAVRETDYSTSGRITTWKLGLTYSPIDDFGFRFTRSRDIRAPDLAELFQNNLSQTNTVTDTTKSGVQPNDSIYQVTQGNRALQPEIAHTTTFGVIFHPSFLPGFAGSVDYYTTRINGAITSPTAQQVVNECADGVTALCSQIVRNAAGTITTVYILPVNLASQLARGIDFEAGYGTPLSTIAAFLPGNLDVRLLATRYLENTLNTGIAGVTPINYVGDDSGNGTYGTTSLPHWKYAATAAWGGGPVTLTFTARGFSAGVINSTYIQCTTGCPAATANNPTISNNSLPGALYFDTNINYKLPLGAEVYVSVDNLANKAPAMVPYGPSIGGAPLSINPNLYDTLGRTFRAGFRFKL